MRFVKSIVSFFPVSRHSERKRPAFDENLIRMIAAIPIFFGNTAMPFLYSFGYFFIQSDGEKILLLEPKELEEIYYRDYSALPYIKFIRKALNQQLIIKTQDKGIAFEPDKGITEIYFNHEFSDFLGIFCENSSETNKYWLKGNLEEHQLFSIFYYFFINNYLTLFDDYKGAYYVLKTSDYLGTFSSV